MKINLIKLTICAVILLNVMHPNKCFGQTRTDHSVTLIDEKVIYETPMAYELMHIAMALTDSTIVSNGYNVYDEVINRNSTYYKEVRNHFTQFKNHELIIELNKSLKKSASNFIYNVQVGNNLNFNNNKLEKINIMPGIRRTYINLKAVNKKKIEDFARISKFEEFYNQHKNYYKTELELVRQNSNVNSQQKWLETEFPAKYDNYRIIVSPLMGSTHFTQRFKKSGESKCIMWVASYNGNQQQIDNVEKASYTGIVMTEIDHNYVNPVSDKFKKELKVLMGRKNRTKWTDGGASNSYKSGYSVFNEYMTHAVYLLYINQQISTQELSIIEKSKISVMTKRRKFIKFAEFYEHLKSIYQNRKPNETIADLYPLKVAWCESENAK